MYLDGLRVVVQNTPTDNTGNGGNNTGNEGSGDNVATVDKSAETLTICTDAEDLMQKANIIGTPNGTAEAEKTNTYGASAEAVAWSGVAAYQNMFLYVSLDHSALTITADGYIEFFIKDTGHTSDATTRASGVNLVLYKDSSNKVDGFSANVSAYKTHNNEYRTDAGNGWSYYKIPLTLFGSVGASFDRIRFAANVAFDDGEIMYLDGLRVVVKNTTTENGATDNTTTGNTTTDNTATVDKGEFVTTSFTDNTQYCTITGDATSGYTLTTADRTYSRLRIPGKNYSTGMYQGKTLEFTFKPAAGSNVTVKLSTVDSSYTTSSYVTISLTDGYNQNGISVAYDQTTGEYTVIVNMDAFFAANALDGTQVRYLLLQIDGSAAQTELITFTGMYIY
jgi:hypothetical protein